MSEQTTDNIRVRVIPGLDEEAMPLLSLGLGLTGLTLGLKPRLAPVPLALTALTALLYRDPKRTTPGDSGALFAAADGVVFHVGECYEHRYLHTDAIRIATVLSPLDVPVCRSPAAGTVQYLEHVPGEYRPTRSVEAADYNTRTYIGIEASWGPILVVQVASPLARRIVSHVEPGDQVQAGERIGTARFGARTDLIVQRDSIRPLIETGHRLVAGVTRTAHVVPL
jgi:phosphatidylserine decarboxylase